MEVVGKARAIYYDDLFAIFSDVPKPTLYNTLWRLRGSYDRLAEKHTTPLYLQDITPIISPVYEKYVKKLGRRHPIIQPGPSCQEFLGDDYPIKHADFTSQEKKFHVIMGAKYAATIHAAAHKKLIKLFDYKREPRGQRLPVGWIHAPEIDEQKKTPFEPDANYIIEPNEPNEPVRNYVPFSFHEDETGTVHVNASNLNKSSWRKKNIIYRRLYNEHAKQGKHPNFKIRVLCLEPDFADDLRKFSYDFDPKLNIYRFILFKHVDPEHPEKIFTEKHWYDFSHDKPLSFFE